MRSSGSQRFAPRGLDVYGPRDPDLISGVISFNFADVHAHDLASILDTEGVCIRAGHHCTMPLMDKMGWSATARASFYLYNTYADIDALADGLEKAAKVFKNLNMFSTKSRCMHRSRRNVSLGRPRGISHGQFV